MDASTPWEGGALPVGTEHDVSHNKVLPAHSSQRCGVKKTSICCVLSGESPLIKGRGRRSLPGLVGGLCWLVTLWVSGLA